MRSKPHNRHVTETLGSPASNNLLRARKKRKGGSEAKAIKGLLKSPHCRRKKTEREKPTLRKKKTCCKKTPEKESRGSKKASSGKKGILANQRTLGPVKKRGFFTRQLLKLAQPQGEEKAIPIRSAGGGDKFWNSSRGRGSQKKGRNDLSQPKR